MKFMKYIFSLIIVIPIVTLADDSYDATIISTAACYAKAIDYSGDTNYHKTSNFLNYNDHVKIKKKEELKDTRLVVDKNGCYIKYTQFIGGIFDPKTFKITNYETPKSLLLLNENVNLYGGPNKDYLDFENTYKNDIIFQYQYSIANKWFFVYYEPEYICNQTDTSKSCSTKERHAMGWAYIDNKNFGIDGDEILYFPWDTNIVDNNGNTIGTIPSHTEITKYYYTYDGDKKIIYTYYNNIEGYVYDIPLFKGNTTIKINKMVNNLNPNEELKINYFNFNYQDKAFIYVASINNLIELNYNDFTIISENIETKNNGYIKEIFNKYKTMKAPQLNYTLSESNKEGKESLPQNYIKNTNNIIEDDEIKEINDIDNQIDVTNQEEKKINYPFIIYTTIIILIGIIILIYQNKKKVNQIN